MLADTEGGGLTDPGHCDQGSTLTLSVQLSPPSDAAGGGVFTTSRWRMPIDGEVAGAQTTEHELAAGDGIVFCSEVVHNVTALPSGAMRRSLVIEWWTSPPNEVDRFA